MDADFSHHPRYLPALRAGMNEDGQAVRDVMIGSRYVPNGGTHGWPLSRRVISRLVNIYTRLLLGLRPRDCSGAFRCFRVETLRKLDFNSIVSHGYSFEEEIIWRLKRNRRSSCVVDRSGRTGTMSLLTLKPTSDKNVVAEDKAAAITPASNIAPISGGIMFIAAQIIVCSLGSMSALLRLTTVAAANSAMLLTAAAIAARHAERITTCSFFASR